MSILRRRKDPGKISRDVSESAARRDTKLERITDQLTVIRSNSGNITRLQKQNPNWPLPIHEDGEPMDVEPERPSTANGPAHTTAPAYLQRRSTSQGIVGLGYEPDVVPESPKKKKFGALRKIFGLHD